MIKTLTTRIGFYLLASIFFMVVMLLFFTGFYHYTENLDWLDAFYFTVITTRTIGFGDISPTTELGKIGTILNALVPATVFLGASLVVLETVMKGMEEYWRKFQMKKNSQHDIIVADVEMLDSILKEYTTAKEKYVVISQEKYESLPQKLQSILHHGSFLEGDATKDEVLERAGIKKADTILIATGNDSFNIYVLVTAKMLNPEIKKIVRINNVENTSKFTSVGADSVLPSATVIGQMLSEASLHPFSHEFLVSLHTQTQDPFLEDVIPDDDHVGKKIVETYRRPVAVYRDGRFIFDLVDEKVEKGDIIIRIQLKYKEPDSSRRRGP